MFWKKREKINKKNVIYIIKSCFHVYLLTPEYVCHLFLLWTLNIFNHNHHKTPPRPAHPNTRSPPSITSPLQRSPKPPSSHEPNDTPTDLHITTPWHIRRFKFGTEMGWLHREGELRGVGSQVISQVCRANSKCGRSQYQLPTFFDTKKLNYTLGLSIIVIFWLFFTNLIFHYFNYAIFIHLLI